VPVYGWVAIQVEVQKTRQMPVYENRLTVKCGMLRFHPDDPGKRVCWPETVKVQTGTKTETYTATETRMVQKQTGTRTETYETGETRRVQKQTGTRIETYTDTETRTGTRTVHNPRHPSHCSNPAYAKTCPQQDCEPTASSIGGRTGPPGRGLATGGPAWLIFTVLMP
jgi:hypothetical protein